MSESVTIPSHLRHRKLNGPLLIGSVLVLFIFLLGVFGASLAPNDPREEHLIIQVDGEWMTAPYPALTPGFPLGSDNLGRDLFSWLLWSVRPTMILVIVVALQRMILGLLIGVGAGWSDSWFGRLCDSLVAAALAVPTLLAALIVITAVGFHFGVWAFVLGLGITGWAETAQLVREQTRTVRGQQAVEAARALGASSGQIFFLHILPQVMPMMWMLLAFEVSNTLMATAGLGFLGYYLGGAMFVEVDDFVYQRIAGMPELGQMLATAWMVLDEPWAMVAAGTVVFVIVLAFNLLGEGLQQRLTHKLGGNRRFYTFMARDMLPWFRRRLGEPLSDLSQRRAFRPLIVVALVIVVGGGMLWWRPDIFLDRDVDATNIPPVTPLPSHTDAENNGKTAVKLPVPGGHFYANEGLDPWRTRWAAYSGPVTTTVRWTFETEGFRGGPAVDAAGNLYIADSAGVVYALDDQGSVVWTTTVEGPPVGSPALAADGTLYIGEKGGIQAISTDGQKLWHFAPEDGKLATSGPVVGPDGTVYYKSYSGLLALTSGGELRWHAPISETAATLPPYLSPDGQFVLWDTLAFYVEDGLPLEWSQKVQFSEGGTLFVFSGADGNLYHLFALRLLHGIPPDSVDLEETVFDWSRQNSLDPLGDAGVTASGRPWITARIPFGLGLAWNDNAGEFDIFKLIDTNRIHVAGVSVDEVAYLCVDNYDSSSKCYFMDMTTNETPLQINLLGTRAVAGVALAPGRLYITSWDGKFVAVGAAQTQLAQSNAPQDVSAVTGALPVPGQHLWAMARHDPWGTSWSRAIGPQQSQQAWVFTGDGAFTGGPAIAADGTLYAATESGTLYALDPEGQPVWQTTLITGGVGSPALDAAGNVYVVDVAGGLSAYTPRGDSLWRVLPENAGIGYSGPMVAPDSSAAGGVTAYYLFTRTGKLIMQAVANDGSLLWESSFEFAVYRDPPFLSPSGEWLFWQDYVVNAHDGTRLDPAMIGPDVPSHYFTGADGMAYAHVGSTLVPLAWTGDSFAATQQGIWWLLSDRPPDARGSLRDGGVTPDGLGWIMGNFTSFRGTQVIWGRMDDLEITEAVGSVGIGYLDRPQVLAVDRHGTLYMCGMVGTQRDFSCYALSPDLQEPLWQIELSPGEKIEGGALAPNRVYFTGDAGNLYAIGVAP